MHRFVVLPGMLSFPETQENDPVAPWPGRFFLCSRGRCEHCPNVRFWPKADVSRALRAALSSREYSKVRRRRACPLGRPRLLQADRHDKKSDAFQNDDCRAVPAACSNGNYRYRKW